MTMHEFDKAVLRKLKKRAEELGVSVDEVIRDIFERGWLYHMKYLEGYFEKYPDYIYSIVSQDAGAENIFEWLLDIPDYKKYWRRYGEGGDLRLKCDSAYYFKSIMTIACAWIITQGFYWNGWEEEEEED